jgi:DNA ligase-1
MKPTNFMLAEPMPTAQSISDYFGSEVYAEYKYDGIRAQLHKFGGQVRIFSRRLEDISGSFPEIAEDALKIPHEFVLDGEIVPFKDGRPLSFQLLQRRLRRKSEFEQAAKTAPVTYFAFDVLSVNGRDVHPLPLSERSRHLEELLKGSRIVTAQRSHVNTSEQLEKLFRESRELGYEGLVVKDPKSPYTPGKRGRFWLKLKEELDTLDVVIVAAEFGHGKRAGVISDYTFAVRSDGQLKTIGKAYSGLTDLEIDVMTRKLKEITIDDQGYRRTVKPEIVLEVAFDSIQRSDRHQSGFALRFPRIKRIREDKSVEDIDTLAKVEQIFEQQKVRID